MIIFILIVAFLLELIALVSFAFSAVFLPIDKSFQLFAGVFFFLALIVFWSLFMAPKAPRKFTKVPYYVCKTIIYAISAVVLFTQTNVLFGILFVLAALLDEIFLYKHNTASRMTFDNRLKNK